MHKVGIFVSIMIACALVSGAYILRAEEVVPGYDDLSDVVVPNTADLPEEHWINEHDAMHELILFPDTVFREYKNGTQIRYGVWESEMLFYEDGTLGVLTLTNAVMEGGVRPVQKLSIVEATGSTLGLKDAQTQETTTYHLRAP